MVDLSEKQKEKKFGMQQDVGINKFYSEKLANKSEGYIAWSPHAQTATGKIYARSIMKQLWQCPDALKFETASLVNVSILNLD